MRQTLLPESGERSIDEQDWTFASADTGYMTHGLHPYPARMIPQIARRLILSYSKEGELVWDPFCGSGSVLVEAMLLGRKCVGTDLNPYAVFLSRVKTTPIQPSLLRKALDHVVQEAKSLHNSAKGEIERPNIPNIDYWFKPSVQRDLANLRRVLDTVENAPVRAFLKLCFALATRDVSNLKKREFKIVRMKPSELDKFQPNAFASFLAQTRRCIPLMDAFASNLPKNAEPAVVLEADNRHTPIEPESVDLVVTSPPYGDHSTTVAYGQFSRYPALWIGLKPDDVMTVDRRGLGGRSTREYDASRLGSEALDRTYEKVQKQSPKRAKQLYNFVFELNESLQSIHEKLRKGARACIVVGNRLMSRVRVPTNEIIGELGKTIGLKHKMTIPRNIPTKRMPWKNAPENIAGELANTIHTENIIILTKD